MKLKRRTFLKLIGIGLACPTISIAKKLTFKEQVHKVCNDIVTNKVNEGKGLQALYKMKKYNDVAFKRAIKDCPDFVKAVNKVAFLIISEPENNDFYQCDTIKRRNQVRYYHAWRERIRERYRQKPRPYHAWRKELNKHYNTV